MNALKPIALHLDPKERMAKLDSIAESLSQLESYHGFYKQMYDGPMPSLQVLEELMARLKMCLFPGFYGSARVKLESLRYHVSANLDSIFRMLAEQIRRGACFSCAEHDSHCTICEETAKDLAMNFINTLPQIRNTLVSDVIAAYEGDPAARSPGETIFCYPSIVSMINHRIAHELYKLDVPFIPRIISEMAHSATGIDIHPGANIGESFFIDHGTGVVIGETCIIGNNCRLYQGVTLGALSFPKDENGLPIKGIPRHPILEDNVTVYANATILGRITIGKGSIIGGNVWLTETVPPKSKVIQQQSTAPAKDEQLIGKKD